MQQAVKYDFTANLTGRPTGKRSELVVEKFYIGLLVRYRPRPIDADIVTTVLGPRNLLNSAIDGAS